MSTKHKASSGLMMFEACEFPGAPWVSQEPEAPATGTSNATLFGAAQELPPDKLAKRIDQHRDEMHT